jgi:surface antigen
MMTSPRPTPIHRLRARILNAASAALIVCALALPALAPAAERAPPPPPPPAPPMRVTTAQVATLPAAARAGQQQRKVETAATAPNTRKKTAKRQQATRQHAAAARLPCVQFVRQTTEFRLSGNAHLWWSRAAGVHARGSVPEVGSILSFKSIKSMPMGHIAVVSQVISSREIRIDHSNWVHGGVVRGAEVVDVSPRNDWTAVRVSLKPGTASYGSIYPTNGFIHARPHGSDVANLAERPVDMGMPRLGPAPRDLRPQAERATRAPG